MPSDTSRPRILFVDDDADVRKAAALLLARHGFVVIGAPTTEEAWSLLAEEPVDVVLLDLNFAPEAVSGAEGMRCLAGLMAHDPDSVVVVVTGHSGVNIAVAAMRAGAADFVMKPWRNDRLLATLTDAVAVSRHRRQARAQGAAGTAPAPEPLFLGVNPAARRAHGLAARAAATSASVLLTGEAGSGKSCLADLIHRGRGHEAGALAVLDCTALPETSPADAATLLVDHVDRLPAVGQARLLGWLAPRANLRLIAMSRVPADGLSLRADLRYRIGTITIALPPLREQAEDLAALAAHLLRVFARRHARPDLVWSAPALEAIAAAPWPGNLWTLRQAVERAVVLAQGPVLQPQDVLDPAAAQDAGTPSALNLARSEKAMVEAALRLYSFNVSRAAKELGLTRAALYRRMARHGL